MFVTRWFLVVGTCVHVRSFSNFLDSVHSMLASFMSPSLSTQTVPTNVCLILSSVFWEMIKSSLITSGLGPVGWCDSCLGESCVSFRYMGQTLLWLAYFEMYLVAGSVG